MLTIRVDDFPGTKPNEFWKHNLENFKRFNYKITSYTDEPYVLGVIPGYTTPADLKWLSDQQNIVIAMHGVVHDESHQDEFYGKTYQDIWSTLLQTKNFLELVYGRRVINYIPPHNVINADTVLALSRLGFEFVFGGPETSEEMKSMIRMMGMEYMHSEPPLEYGRSDELMERGSLEHLEKECKKRDVCLSLHWTWEYNIGLQHLDSYLMKLRDLGLV